MMQGSQHNEVIRNWMLSNIQKQGYERYEDLHIDKIDQAWTTRDSWIQGAFEAFRMALEIRNQQAPSFSVVLAFALVASLDPRGLEFRTLEEMKAELGTSPPSLYLFQKGTEPWTKRALSERNILADNIVVKPLSPHILRGLGRAKLTYYIEFRQVEFKEYSRSILVAG